MKFHQQTQNRLLGRVALVRDEQLHRAVPSAEALDLLEHITSLPYGAPTERLADLPKSDLRSARRLRIRDGGILPKIVPAGVAVISLLTAMLLAGVLLPKPVAAGIKITTKNGYYIARVTDPEASSDQLSAAFGQLGLDVKLQLIPVSPTLVGTIVAIGEDGSTYGIETIRDDDQCVSGGGGCPVGLRIPLDYGGEAEITLGRSARPGEQYMSMASALAPGEVLHCSGIHGVPIDEALPVLQQRGLTVTFQALVEREGNQFAEEVPASDVFGWYVSDVLPKAERHVLIQASEEIPLPLPASYAARIESGCNRHG